MSQSPVTPTELINRKGLYPPPEMGDAEGNEKETREEKSMYKAAAFCLMQVILKLPRIDTH